MGPQISPLESFPIVYLISDPTDSGTYFVRSIMRNSATGAIIKIANQNFVNLTDKGNRRFAKLIQAPSDPSGNGFWIDITTTVYTDSGYTSVSPNYEEVLDKYLVQARWSIAQSSPGGFSWSSEMFAKLIRENLPEQKDIKIPKVNLEPVYDYLRSIGKRADGIHAMVEAIRPVDMPNMQEVSKGIISALKAEIEANKTERFDPSNLIEAINGITFPDIPEAFDYSDHFQNLSKKLNEIRDNLPDPKRNDVFDSFVEGLSRSVSKARRVNPGRFTNLKI